MTYADRVFDYLLTYLSKSLWSYWEYKTSLKLAKRGHFSNIIIKLRAGDEILLCNDQYDFTWIWKITQRPGLRWGVEVPYVETPGWLHRYQSDISQVLYTLTIYCKHFIMSTEFDKNISDWRYDFTDCENGFVFSMRLVKWPKIAVKKCQNLIFKVNFQRQKINRIFLKKKFVGEYQFRSTFFVFINFV